MDLNSVSKDEIVAKFGCESDCNRTGRKGLKAREFKRRPNEDGPSVFRINKLDEPEIWEIGDYITLRRARPQKAEVRAEFLVCKIEGMPGKSLKVTPRPNCIHVGHSVILGYPNWLTSDCAQLEQEIANYLADIQEPRRRQ